MTVDIRGGGRMTLMGCCVGGWGAREGWGGALWGEGQTSWRRGLLAIEEEADDDSAAAASADLD